MGFKLDIRTLSFVTVLFSFIYGVGLFCVGWLQRSSYGITTFALALFTTGLGFSLLGLRGILPDWMSIVTANLLIYLGFVFMRNGISRFRESPVMHIAMDALLLSLLLLLVLYNTYAQPSVSLRSVWVSLAIALQSGFCVLQMLQGSRKELAVALWMTVIPYIFSTAFFIFRALWAFDDRAMPSFMTAGVVHQAAFLMVNIIILTSSFGLLWMVSARLEMMLREQATTDTLTKTYNRRALEEIHAREIARARRHNLPMTVIMTDIDHFKHVNDAFGHQVGDMVLANFASLIEANIRKQDILVRYGGEEFLVLLPDTTKEQGAQAAEKLRTIIFEELLSHDPDVMCTSSFGVAELLLRESWDSLTARADAALYEAKGKGRNMTVVSDG